MAIIGGDQGKAGESKGSGRKADDLRLSCLCLLLLRSVFLLDPGYELRTKCSIPDLESKFKYYIVFVFPDKSSFLCYSLHHNLETSGPRIPLVRSFLSFAQGREVGRGFLEPPKDNFSSFLLGSFLWNPMASIFHPSPLIKVIIHIFSGPSGDFNHVLRLSPTFSLFL